MPNIGTFPFNVPTDLSTFKAADVDPDDPDAILYKTLVFRVPAALVTYARPTFNEPRWEPLDRLKASDPTHFFAEVLRAQILVDDVARRV